MNYSTGLVQVYGDYQLSGSTLTLDYASQIYASTATNLKVMVGAEATSNFTIVWTSDTYAVSQLVTLTATDATHWQVAGSSTSGTVTIGVSGSGSWPSSNPQVNISIGATTPAVGDRVDFALIAASQDQNAQKKLQFGPAGAFNHGRSKIEIGNTSGFHAVGQSAVANPTLIDMMSGGTYYTFVDSGAFTIQYASMTNMDESGVQIWYSSGCSRSQQHLRLRRQRTILDLYSDYAELRHQLNDHSGGSDLRQQPCQYS